MGEDTAKDRRGTTGSRGPKRFLTRRHGDVDRLLGHRVGAVLCTRKRLLPQDVAAIQCAWGRRWLWPIVRLRYSLRVKEI